MEDGFAADQGEFQRDAGSDGRSLCLFAAGACVMMDRSSPLAEQFATPVQQRTAATLGIWVFIATELMFFGPLFLGYLFGRIHFGDAFVAASLRTHLWL